MIHIAFIYKNSCVKQDSVDVAFTADNKYAVYDDIVHGSIDRPANYDRVMLTEHKLKNTLWVK